MKTQLHQLTKLGWYQRCQRLDDEVQNLQRRLDKRVSNCLLETLTAEKAGLDAKIKKIKERVK